MNEKEARQIVSEPIDLRFPELEKKIQALMENACSQGYLEAREKARRLEEALMTIASLNHEFKKGSLIADEAFTKWKETI